MNWKPGLVTCLLLFGSAADSGDLSLRRSTVDGGGGQLSAADLVLNSTIGQVDAARMVGGSYVLTAGFWTREGSQILFSDGFE